MAMLPLNRDSSSSDPLKNVFVAGIRGGSEWDPRVDATAAPWFAIRVKPNYEKTVAATLKGKGFEEFLPLQRTRRQWSDRIKIVDMPLFPGYLFCRLNLDERMPLLTTPGFLYIVGIGRNPEPVDEAEILAIQSVLRSGLPVKPWPSLVVGERVRIKDGPLRGVEGVLSRIANQHRMYVSVTLLKRSVSVEVNPEWIHPVGLTQNGSHTPKVSVPGSGI
jgi:transcription termination/antitermination protein NusG